MCDFVQIDQCKFALIPRFHTEITLKPAHRNALPIY